MKLLQNVLIKLARGGFTDRVLYIDNVPEEMFYEMRYPQIITGKGAEQHYEPDMTSEKIPTLYPEITLSQVGDGGLVFDMDNEQSKHRYLALDRFIKSSYPNNKVPAEPVVFSTDPMNSAAPALPYSSIPRVVLPTLSPAEAPAPVVGSAMPSSLDVEAIKKQAVEQYKAEQKALKQEAMAKAREARKA